MRIYIYIACVLFCLTMGATGAWQFQKHKYQKLLADKQNEILEQQNQIINDINKKNEEAIAQLRDENIQVQEALTKATIDKNKAVQQAKKIKDTFEQIIKNDPTTKAWADTIHPSSILDSVRGLNNTRETSDKNGSSKNPTSTSSTSGNNNP